MKFSTKDFLVNVTKSPEFIEEILNRELHFLCSEINYFLTDQLPKELTVFRKIHSTHRSNHRLRPATLLKNRPWHRCFPVNFARFLRTPFLHNTSGQLLLSTQHYLRCMLEMWKKIIYEEDKFMQSSWTCLWLFICCKTKSKKSKK